MRAYAAVCDVLMGLSARLGIIMFFPDCSDSTSPPFLTCDGRFQSVASARAEFGERLAVAKDDSKAALEELFALRSGAVGGHHMVAAAAVERSGYLLLRGEDAAAYFPDGYAPVEGESGEPAAPPPRSPPDSDEPLIAQMVTVRFEVLRPKGEAEMHVLRQSRYMEDELDADRRASARERKTAVGDNDADAEASAEIDKVLEQFHSQLRPWKHDRDAAFAEMQAMAARHRANVGGRGDDDAAAAMVQQASGGSQGRGGQADTPSSQQVPAMGAAAGVAGGSAVDDKPREQQEASQDNEVQYNAERSIERFTFARRVERAMPYNVLAMVLAGGQPDVTDVPNWPWFLCEAD